MNAERKISAVEREHTIDVIKTVAIFSVLTIHASTGGYGEPIMSFNWWTSLFWGCLTRSAVPLFLMCSGALMLNPNKKISVKRLYTHNLWHLVTAMFAWAVFYKIYHMIATKSFYWENIVKSVREIFLLDQEFHLYYIPIAALAYLFLPITRVVTANASKRQLQYCVLLWFVLAIVYPLLRLYWPLYLVQGAALQYGINMTYAGIGYGVLGYYLKKYPLSHKCCLVLIGLGFSIVYGMTTILTITQGELYDEFLGGMTPGVCLLGTGIFGLLCQLQYSAAVYTVAMYISKASFCIYLVHVWFNNIFSQHGLTVTILPCLISVPLLVCLNFALSYVVYLLLSHIPVVRRYII